MFNLCVRAFVCKEFYDYLLIFRLLFTCLMMQKRAGYMLLINIIAIFTTLHVHCVWNKIILKRHVPGVIKTLLNVCFHITDTINAWTHFTSYL